MEIYLIKSNNPVMFEGAPVVTAVFTDKGKAEEAVERLTSLEEAGCRRAMGDNWRVFATSYELETRSVTNDVQSLLYELFPAGV